MAINFPNSPSDGQTTTILGVTYTYDSDLVTWTANPPGASSSGLDSAATISLINENAGSGVTSYDSAGLLPSSSNTAGDLAFVKDKKAMYVWDSSEWDRLYNGPETSLAWTTEALSSYSLNSTGVSTTITTAASDPEGFPITYSYDVTPTNQTQATIVDSGNGNFVLTPSTNDSDAGSFTFRSKATDGLYSISKSSSISLAFFTEIVYPNQSNSTASITNGGDNSWTYSSSDYHATSGALFSNDLNQGKIYFEVRVDNVGTANHSFMIGLISSSAGAAGYTTVGAYSLFANNGNIYPGNITTSFGQISVNDVMQIAYDTSTGEVWFNKNNGSWYPNAPTSSSSLTIATGTIKLLMMSGGSAAADYNFTALTGNNLVYSIPNGFTFH